MIHQSQTPKSVIALIKLGLCHKQEIEDYVQVRDKEILELENYLLNADNIRWREV